MNLNISNKALGIYIAISIIFAGFSYFYIDLQLNTFIRENAGQSVLNIAEYITELGNAKYYYIALLFLYVFYILNRKNKGLLKKLNFSLGAMSSTTAITYIAKFIIGRSRPKMWIENGEYGFNPFYFGNTYDFTSLPSGHTQTSFTVAILLSIFFPKYRNVFIIIAIISGLSRVVLSAHWLGDVVMGAVFGLVIPIILYKKYKKTID